jgi:hypothetical protein
MLAALRLWQREVPEVSARVDDVIASDGGDLEPLVDSEIDDLCGWLNCGHGRW